MQRNGFSLGTCEYSFTHICWASVSIQHLQQIVHRVSTPVTRTGVASPGQACL